MADLHSFWQRVANKLSNVGKTWEFKLWFKFQFVCNPPWPPKNILGYEIVCDWEQEKLFPLQTYYFNNSLIQSLGLTKEWPIKNHHVCINIAARKCKAIIDNAVMSSFTQFNGAIRSLIHLTNRLYPDIVQRMLEGIVTIEHLNHGSNALVTSA